MGKTKIEWATDVWNPVTGCDHVSPGCDNCYAERIATRFGRPFLGAVECHEDRLDIPLRWRKPRRVFVNSVSDLFHPDVPDEFIAKVFARMALTPWHTYQVLTKRPQRMATLVSPLFDTTYEAVVDVVRSTVDPDVAFANWRWPLPNVWLGVSVENQRYADLRIPHLLATPAAVRFLSVEPLLGPVALGGSWHDYLTGWTTREEHDSGCPGGGPYCETHCPVPVQEQTARVDWVIVGGESGPGARPMHPEWARDLRDQCVSAAVPYFFKQWGAWQPVDGLTEARGKQGAFIEPDGKWESVYTATPSPDAQLVRRIGKKVAGRELDGRTWDEYPAGEGT